MNAAFREYVTSGSFLLKLSRGQIGAMRQIYLDSHGTGSCTSVPGGFEEHLYSLLRKGLVKKSRIEWTEHWGLTSEGHLVIGLLQGAGFMRKIESFEASKLETAA